MLEIVFYTLIGIALFVAGLIMAITVLTSWNERQPFGPGRRTVAEDWPSTTEERECQDLARTRFRVEEARCRGRRVLGERLQLNGELRRVV